MWTQRVSCVSNYKETPPFFKKMGGRGDEVCKPCMVTGRQERTTLMEMVPVTGGGAVSPLGPTGRGSSSELIAGGIVCLRGGPYPSDCAIWQKANHTRLSACQYDESSECATHVSVHSTAEVACYRLERRLMGCRGIMESAAPHQCPRVDEN